MPSSGFVQAKIAAATKRFSEPLLPELAAKRLRTHQATRRRRSTETAPLLDFIPQVSPHLDRPDRFACLTEAIEGAHEPGALRIVGASPPQHGKTTTIAHGLLWLGLRYPNLKHAYITYSKERAEAVSTEFQRLADEAGAQPTGRLSDVTLASGSSVRFTSIGGSFTGYTVDGLMVIDDPHKDRAEAESPTIRRKIIDWFTDVAMRRRGPKTSIVVIATRWHPEDLSGECIGRGYRYINLKALAEGSLDAEGRVADDPLHRLPGEALWPEVRPVAFFEEDRADEYSWASQFQGEPRPRGESVFRYPDVANAELFFDEAPSAPMRVCIGADFAYTAKTRADYSVAVVLGQIGAKHYVLNVIRRQCEPRLFRELLLAECRLRGAKVAAYVAATEQGGIEFIREGGVDALGMSAQKAGDKFTRALDVAAAWNTGNVILPTQADWRDAFLGEVCSFTGQSDKHDDQVDALAAAYDGLRATGWQSPDWTYLSNLQAVAPKPFNLDAVEKW